MSDTINQDKLEVTILYPCLNEEDAIGECVREALAVFAQEGLSGEVLVVDNNSTDRSAEIARAEGARVVEERRPGYGSAYLKGFEEARGTYIIMLDADGTYPVEMSGEFVSLMRDEGVEMVIGNRFGGKMEDNAMPWMNQHIGNPILSTMTRILYRVDLRDMHCGMRGVRRAVIPRLQLQTPGMEFATEMIVKALDQGVRYREVVIPYRPRVGDSKLQPFRDAWRHIEYMLVFAPSASFLWPGFVLTSIGFIVQVILLAGPRHIFFRTWNVHTNLLGVVTSLTGNTLIVLGLISAALARAVGMDFIKQPLARFFSSVRHRSLRLFGVALLTGGLLMWLAVIARWLFSGGESLSAVAFLSFATSVLVVGAELLGCAFLLNVIRLQRR